MDMQETKIGTTKWFLKTIWQYIRPYKNDFWLGSVIRISSDLVWLYPAYALAYTIDFFTDNNSGNSLDALYRVLLVWIVFSVWRYTGNYWAKFKLYKIAEQIQIDAEIQSLNHLFKVDTAWQEMENSGNKMKRIQRGAESLNRVVRIWANNIVEIGVNFIGMTIIIARTDSFTAFMFAGFIILHYSISFFLTRRATRAALEVNAYEENVSGLAFEAINNVRTVKVLDLEKPLIARLQEATHELYKKIVKRIFRFQIERGLTLSWLSQAFRLGGVLFIVYNILHGRMEVGFLALFYSYFNAVWQSVSELSEVSQDIVIAKISLNRLNEILEAPITRPSEYTTQRFPSDWHILTLNNINFGYGDNEVLKNLNLEVLRGQKVGIVGLSGAGKSTLFKLLLKEYENYSGQIALDNVLISEINKTDFFKHVAVVMQETEVFNFSLKENITLGNLEKAEDLDLLEKAITTAHVKDYLPKLPQGLETIIGEKGIKLSGGEKQRLGIARAIFKQPQILLLDEATSHLDLESEQKIQESLKQFFEEVTAIVIAHRLTTVKEMDKIVVVENGESVEQGSFTELINQKGRFYELWQKQKFSE